MEVLETLHEVHVFFRSLAFIVFFRDIGFTGMDQRLDFCKSRLFITRLNHGYCDRVMNGVPHIIGNPRIIHHSLVYDGTFQFHGTKKAFRLVMANSRGNPSPTRLPCRIISHFHDAARRDRLMRVLCHDILLSRFTLNFQDAVTGMRHGIRIVSGSKENGLITGGTITLFQKGLLTKNGGTWILVLGRCLSTNIEAHCFVLNGLVVARINAGRDFVQCRLIWILFIDNEEIHCVIDGRFPFELMFEANTCPIREWLCVARQNQTIGMIDPFGLQNACGAPRKDGLIESRCKLKPFQHDHQATGFRHARNDRFRIVCP